MQSTHAEIKKQLACYQFGLLSDEEKLHIEAHLFDCADCLDDLYEFTPIVDLLETMPEQFIPLLALRASVIDRLHYAAEKIIAMIKRVGSVSPAVSPKTIWDWIPFRLLAPVMAVVLIIILIWFVPEKNYSDLAILQKATYRPLQLRGSAQNVKTLALFDEAMAFYQADNYSAAIEKLTAYIIESPADPWGYYYLGISLLITGSASQSLSYLITAGKIADEQNERSLHEQCLWYLGNAYLKLNNKDAALTTFQTIVNLQSKLASAAEVQIINIQKR
ncbi:MAG: zf-HC2 domain-containing protein [candidate division KSB1 bacterium]|nr:zf-HC2 domain-containing protein [candidate division KSB1 bacterium]MDZ7317585.1 zf-HC2 domain-containing protein [candidate division KSB1 bacterium]MDZ7340192.1 zf-HC2 domain-containing protein [candidate division KSB1 bacterium]